MGELGWLRWGRDKNCTCDHPTAPLNCLRQGLVFPSEKCVTDPCLWFFPLPVPGTMAKRRLNSTQILRISSTFGGRKCFRTPRIS